MDANQQEQEAFERSFAETSGTSLPSPAPAAPAAEEAAAAPAAEAAAPAAPGTEDQPNADAGEGAAPDASGEEDDPIVFEGYKRSEVQRLLSAASEVEGLKRQLDKAHGNIGELNRRVQKNQSAVPAPAPAFNEVSPELSQKLKQFEEDYPDVAEYMRILGASQQPKPSAAPPAEVQPPEATGEAQSAQAGLDPMNIELAVMDRMHKGWREKVQSPEFNVWLAAQEEQAQQAFAEATTADGVAAVIGQYDQFVTARSSAAEKAARGQQRLKAAVTPTGNAPRPQSAPTEEEAFQAAFQATLNRR
ncbi:hypothetical protein ACQYWY_06860 [Comamonas sediminis]|uniref:hypothetical protein n=1 Tax=Comamonas sediminis TaxID=1783360 RepID=UPI003D2CB5DA